MNIAKALADYVNDRHRATHFRAIVTGFSGNLVYVRRDGQPLADSQPYAQMATGVALAPGDEVRVEDDNGEGGFIVIGKILR